MCVSLSLSLSQRFEFDVCNLLLCEVNTHYPWLVQDPTAPNEDYLAIHVFRPSGKDEGKRVYYPDNYLSNGTYIDSLHRLTRLDVTPEKGEQTITVVVVISLFERLRDVYFTLRVYSEDAMIDFQVRKDITAHKDSEKMETM